jgi:nitrogen fixation NifU-like protein
MNYNHTIVDRFDNAHKNAGSMDENDPTVGVGLVGSPSCGDVMRFYIKVENNKIVDACFQTFGCGSAISSSSLLVDKVLGKTIPDALQITDQEIFQELKLPPVKYHCSVLAEAAVREAVLDWESKNV